MPAHEGTEQTESRHAAVRPLQVGFLEADTTSTFAHADRRRRLAIANGQPVPAQALTVLPDEGW